jgi:predicted nucleic acid-binding protein
VILPDVNVLAYAFRDDSIDHARYRDWLDGVVNGDEAYGMSPQVLCSMARVVTHPPQRRRRRDARMISSATIASATSSATGSRGAGPVSGLDGAAGLGESSGER